MKKSSCLLRGQALRRIFFPRESILQWPKFSNLQCDCICSISFIFQKWVYSDSINHSNKCFGDESLLGPYSEKYNCREKAMEIIKAGHIFSLAQNSYHVRVMGFFFINYRVFLHKYLFTGHMNLTFTYVKCNHREFLYINPIPLQV